MGFFSKLFSQEDEDPSEPQKQDAQAQAPADKAGAPKSTELRDHGLLAQGAPARSSASERARRAASSTSSDQQEKPPRTEPADAKRHPPLPQRAAPVAEALPADAAVKLGARKPAGLPKRDGAAAVKPPPALGGAAATAAKASLLAARPVAPAQPKADAPVPNAERAKTAPSPRPARTQTLHGRQIVIPAGHAALGAEAEPKRALTPAASAVDAAAHNPRDGGGMLPLEAAVDAAIAALVDTSAEPPSLDASSEEELDRRAVAEIFADMAKLHVHPLRELMFQLSVGRTPRQWAGACRAVLRPLLDAAKQIGLLEMVGALGAFDAALERAAGEPSACIGDAAREALQSAYERLGKQMPEAFTAPDRAESRRLILLESLLLQVPSVHRRTLAKLYAAGLSSLSQLSQAKPDELSAVTGIDRRLAQAVVEHIQRFERERNRVDPTVSRSHVHERLRAIVGRLTQLQGEFERAEQDDSIVRKRAARRGREAAVLELDLLFAEVGDVDLIEELKRRPVRAKIRRVENYLEQLQSSG
jgi:hypothetical protein